MALVTRTNLLSQRDGDPSKSSQGSPNYTNCSVPHTICVKLRISSPSVFRPRSGLYSVNFGTPSPTEMLALKVATLVSARTYVRIGSYDTYGTKVPHYSKTSLPKSKAVAKLRGAFRNWAVTSRPGWQPFRGSGGRGGSEEGRATPQWSGHRMHLTSPAGAFQLKLPGVYQPYLTLPPCLPVPFETAGESKESNRLPTYLTNSGS